MKAAVLASSIRVWFLRSGHGWGNEQTRLDLVLVLTDLVAQRVAVVDVQVRHNLLGNFPAETDTEGGGFLQLLAVLEALQQFANVVLETDSFKEKTVNLFQYKILRLTV